jgi:UPF0755 protein
VKNFIRFCFIVLCLVIFAVGYVVWRGQVLLECAAPSGAKWVPFEVVSGKSGTEVAHDLKSAGVIKDEFAFRMLLRFHPKGKDLRAGMFRLEPSEDSLQVFERLLHSEPLTRQATFPEGLIIPQVAERLKKSEILADTKPFTDLCMKHGKEFGDWLPENLEGYLLPDTYTFPYQNTEKTVIERMVGQFKDTVFPIWEKKKDTAPFKSIHEIVVLASLVEREAQVDSERGLIAGVYVNRVRKEMKLECDATVQYALGKTKAVLLFSDLKIDSPYNTYMYPGLPPGPIANPGRKSLEAAISPTPSEYLYYVRNDIKNDGSHVFGKTYNDHINNCNKYQK